MKRGAPSLGTSRSRGRLTAMQSPCGRGHRANAVARLGRTVLLAGAVAALATLALPSSAQHAGDAPPRLLSETGLFAPGAPDAICAGVLAFSPQYPLWSDGAVKRRWLALPPQAAIDASRPDAWEFPPGTRLWKEFADGRRIETRMIERLADGSWRYLAYVWKEDGSDAELAPPEGIAALPVRGAPGGRYAIPSRGDCTACHEGGAVPVLGFSALQLSPERDPHAPHAEPAAAEGTDLPALVERGLLRNLPRELLDRPPRIHARSADERAVLGYLHGNCGHCHNDPGQSGAGVPLELLLAQYVARADSAEAVLRSLNGTHSRARRGGGDGSRRAELLVKRMRSRDPRVQMPPLGTRIPDSHALALIERWLSRDLTKELEP